jgi:alpha-glucosidase
VLTLYQRILRSRKLLDPEAPLEWVAAGHDDVVAFRRGDVSVVLNVSAAPVVMPAELVAGAEVLLTSWASDDGVGTVPGDATVWLRT